MVFLWDGQESETLVELKGAKALTVKFAFFDGRVFPMNQSREASV